MLRRIRYAIVCILTVAALVTGIAWLAPGPNKGNRGAALVDASPGFSLQLLWDNQFYGLGLSDRAPRRVLSIWLHDRERDADRLSVRYGRVLDNPMPDRAFFRIGPFAAFTNYTAGDGTVPAENFINYHTQFVLPFWFLFGALAAYPGVVLVRGPLWRWCRRLRGLCVKCSYDLMGNVSGVCPECGTAYQAPAGAKLV